MSMTAGQRWSRDRPSKEGWYWFRNDVLVASVVLVYQDVGEAWYMTGPEVDTCELFELDRDEDDVVLNSEWQGPITPHDQEAG